MITADLFLGLAALKPSDYHSGYLHGDADYQAGVDQRKCTEPTEYMRGYRDGWAMSERAARFLATEGRFDATVFDAITGEELEGFASEALFASTEGGMREYARHYEGEWIPVEGTPRNLAWMERHGHEVKLVEVTRG